MIRDEPIHAAPRCGLMRSTRCSPRPGTKACGAGLVRRPSRRTARRPNHPRPRGQLDHHDRPDDATAAHPFTDVTKGKLTDAWSS